MKCKNCEGYDTAFGCGLYKCNYILSKRLAAYTDAEEQGRLVRTPYKVGDLFWAIAYSEPKVIHVRLYQITYHYKDGWILWVENIDNDNDWWKVPLETFKTWSCFDSYKEAEAALKELKLEEEDSEPWLCLSCRYYPPSSTDGKPCTQCNPNDVWHSCWDPAEENE